MSPVKKLTEEEKRRRRKITNLSRRMQVSKEEAENYLNETADLLNDFNKEISGRLDIVGLDGFGCDKGN